MDNQPTVRSVSNKTVLVTISVALVMLLATLIAGYFAKLTVDQKLGGFFDRQADQIGITYHASLATNIATLGGFRGLWNTLGSFNHQSFLTYTDSLDPETTFNAGISSFFYIKPVPSSQRDTFAKSIRREENIPKSYQAFTLHPESTAKTLYPIVYVEPIASRQNSLALDFGTLPDRLAAIEYARDQDALATTTPDIFASTGKLGFIFFLPLYAPGLPIERVAERRVAFRGVVGAAFRSDSAFTHLFGGADPYPYLDFQIYQGEATTPDRLLYDHDESFTAAKPSYEATRIIRIQGQTWTVKIQSKPTFALADAEARLPLIVFVSGLLATALLVAFSAYNLAKIRHTD